MSAIASPTTVLPHNDVPALVMDCGQATFEHLEISAGELARAGALLGDAMAALREHFTAALATSHSAADCGECRLQLEAAMVALQCEDALIQMLDGLHRRTLQMADVLRYVVTPRDASSAAAMVEGCGRTSYEQMASRLRLAFIAMKASIACSSPVGQEKAVAGTVDLF